MRHLGVLALIVGIVLATLLLAVPSSGIHAQEASGTPVPAVRFEAVIDGMTPAVVAAQAGLRLDRVHFAPGARYAVPPEDPSLLLVAVESGNLTVRSSAPLVINRAAAGTAAGAQEPIVAGTVMALGPGDAFVRPPNSAQDLENTGGELAVALTASVAPGGAPGISSTAATPGAQPVGGGLVMALAVVVVPACPAGYLPAGILPVATPGGGGGGGGAGGVAVAIAAAPECVGAGAASGAASAATPVAPTS